MTTVRSFRPAASLAIAILLLLLLSVAGASALRAHSAAASVRHDISIVGRDVPWPAETGLSVQTAPQYVLADIGGRCPDDHPFGLTRSPFGGALRFTTGSSEPALRCYATPDHAQSDLPNVPPPPTGVPLDQPVFFRDSLQYPNSGPAGINVASGIPRVWPVYWDWSELVLRNDDPRATQGWQIELKDAPSDAALAVDAHLIAGVGAGTLTLACRWTDGQGYRLLFDPATSHATLRRVDGPDTPDTVLVDWTEALPISVENWPITLELACAGDILTASANGQSVLTAVDQTYATGTFALGVERAGPESGMVAGKFHNLVLRMP